MKTTKKAKDAILEYGINKLDSYLVGTYGCDLHNKLYNEDYFIIGYYDAEEFLKQTEEGVFGVMNLIKDYEESNFGKVNTDFSSSERVVNMYAYIKGEEILNNSKTLQKKWNEILTEKDIKAIKRELTKMLKDDRIKY